MVCCNRVMYRGRLCSDYKVKQIIRTTLPFVFHITSRSLERVGASYSQASVQLVLFANINLIVTRNLSQLRCTSIPSFNLFLKWVVQSGTQQQARGMATLKAISIRLKSVKNIQKITQSMKMVSAAKYSRAERELKQARPYGEGAAAFYDRAEVVSVEEKPQKLLVAVTSDRGLCGAVHTGVARQIRNELSTDDGTTRVVCIGDKSRAILQRLYGKHLLMVANEVGRKPPTFLDAARIAQEISRLEFNSGKIVYNRFKSVVSYQIAELPLFSLDAVTKAPKINTYDSLDEEVIKSYMEFSLASLLFFAMKEGACSEQSSRMTAMDNASKNAGEMIEKLTLTFNRTRQAVITRELIEIISGASAL